MVVSNIYIHLKNVYSRLLMKCILYKTYSILTKCIYTTQHMYGTVLTKRILSQNVNSTTEGTDDSQDFSS
jgi:hypothetical protein